MDEIWQRYRTFWTPLLAGVGIFLVGLIVVHVLTNDPDVARARVRTQESVLRRKKLPRDRQAFEAQRQAAVALEARVRTWAPRLDQAGGAEPLEAAVSQALQAAHLRGLEPAQLERAVGTNDARVLARFDGDPISAARALTRYTELRNENLALLRTGDPNVAFSGLLNDIWSELRLRANRADVDLKAERLGFGGITSVSRSALLERVLNLALVARVVDLAVREGVRSVDRVQVDPRPSDQPSDAFLRAWPVTISLTGDMASLQPVLAMVTDPQRPIPLAPPGCVLQQPGQGTALRGLVQAQLALESTLVRPDAPLDLPAEEAR